MATTDRRSGITGDLAMKAACYVASTTNITLGSTQVIDGIAVGSTGERVLVKNQDDATENGIYIASGATWSRAKDCDGSRDVIPGSLVYVDRGTTNARTFWAFNSSSTAQSITIGSTNNVTISRVNQALGLGLTTKGDIASYDGTQGIRIPIGATNTVFQSGGSTALWALIGSSNIVATGLTSSGIGTSAITSTHISSSAVTTTKIGSSAVNSTNIKAGAVTGPKIAIAGQSTGDILIFTGSTWTTLAKGASGTSLQSGSSLPFWGTQATVTVLQIASTETSAVATGTGTISNDDTIPGSTEGDEYMALAIAPESTASTLKIDVLFYGSLSIGSIITVSLLQDNSTDAIAAVIGHDSVAGVQQMIPLTHYITPGSTASTTFKVRAGGDSASTTTINGTGGNRRYGGVAASSITIVEYLP